MEKTKIGLFLILIVSVIGLVGFWSVRTIQSGSEYKLEEKMQALLEENELLKIEKEELEKELGALKTEIEDEKQKRELIESEKKDTQTVTNTENYKYQKLIDALEKLIADKVNMKLKSKGTRVGTVQEFLNLYNNTSKKIDNDYGESTVLAIKNFQKKEGLTADGEAGPTTFAKMIEWLKKQG